MKQLLFVATILAGVSLFAADKAQAPAVTPFAVGERVTFLGDSITHGGRYHANLQLFWDLRFPGSGTRLMNCGVSGGTAGGGEEGLVCAGTPSRCQCQGRGLEGQGHFLGLRPRQDAFGVPVHAREDRFLPRAPSGTTSIPEMRFWSSARCRAW